MRINDMQLETKETFLVEPSYGFTPSFLLLLLALVLVMGFARSSFAQESQPRMFSSPGEASNALFQAAQKEDEPALEAILGAGKEVASSGDEAEDKLEREQFSQKYQEMHRLVRDADGSMVLFVGAENWPFPIPLVSENGKWYFDADRGKQEILFRRIGENETTAIEVCEQFAMAKNKDYAKAASEDPIPQFVRQLVSADAANPDNQKSNPFHGYYFRIVKKNSAAQVNGGSRKGEFALVAYPAEYRSSGVMTFVVSRNGVVYEDDLGPTTATSVPKINTPAGSGWHPAE